jgi:hypothetical protein
MVAGRGSAAQAECLRRVREEKRYLKFGRNWADFCAQHRKIPRRTAERIIGQLKKYGPLYFETAALTGISAGEYERIAPHIQPDGIPAAGEVIALIPENAQRAVEAVARLQAEAQPAQPEQPAASAEARIEELQKRGQPLCASFHRTAAVSHGADLRRLLAAVQKIQHLFQDLQLGIKEPTKSYTIHPIRPAGA